MVARKADTCRYGDSGHLFERDVHYCCHSVKNTRDQLRGRYISTAANVLGAIERVYGTQEGRLRTKTYHPSLVLARGRKCIGGDRPPSTRLCEEPFFLSNSWGGTPLQFLVGDVSCVVAQIELCFLQRCRGQNLPLPGFRADVRYA